MIGRRRSNQYSKMACPRYASESNIIRYAKIAMQLQSKTVRDVALRCRWMTKKEFSKRRKEDNLSRKSKDKKVLFTSISMFNFFWLSLRVFKSNEQTKGLFMFISFAFPYSWEGRRMNIIGCFMFL
ncbi:hypothetical protein LINGRAHAP2_LOCUS7037 [Linum grandiflorum]